MCHTKIYRTDSARYHFESDQEKDIVAVRELLCVEGLTRAAVSSYRNIQGDDIRVGVIKQDGKWQFQVWPADGDKTGEGQGLLQDEKDIVETDTSSSMIERGAERPESSIRSIKLTTVEAELMLPDHEEDCNESQPVSPMSPVSYDNAFLTSDHDERRRVSRSLEWADYDR